jgi:hypothetical protein
MDKQEVLDLKARRKAEYDKDMEAIDRVLGLLGTPAPQEDAGAATPMDAGEGTGNRTGFRDLVRQYKDELPQEFTKYDVKKLATAHGFAGDVVENSLLGMMRVLVKEEFATVKTVSSGRTAAIYAKVVK